MLIVLVGLFLLQNTIEMELKMLGSLAYLFQQQSSAGWAGLIIVVGVVLFTIAVLAFCITPHD